MTKEKETPYILKKSNEHPIITFIVTLTLGWSIGWSACEVFKVDRLKEKISSRDEKISSYLREKDDLLTELRQLKLKVAEKDCAENNSNQLIESELKTKIDQNNQLTRDLSYCLSRSSVEKSDGNNTKSILKMAKPIQYKKDGLVFSLLECKGTNTITCVFYVKNTSEEVEINISLAKKQQIPSRAIDKLGKSYKISNMFLSDSNTSRSGIETRIPKDIQLQFKVVLENVSSEIELFSLLEFYYSSSVLQERRRNYHKAEFRNIPIY